MININTLDEKSFKMINASSYVLNQDKYQVLFFIDHLDVEFISTVEKKQGFIKRFSSYFKNKLLCNKLSNENNLFKSKDLSIVFNNANNEALSYIENIDEFTLVYSNIYDGIKLICSFEDDNIICTFLLSEDSNPKDINVTFSGVTDVSLDEHNDLTINLNSSNIIFKRTLYNNKEIDYIFQENNEGKNYFLDIPDVSDEHLDTLDLPENSAINIPILSDPYDPNSYSNVHFLGEEILIVPVSRSKYSYPHDFTTDLFASVSTPLINELLVNRSIETISTPISLCGSSNPPINVFTTTNIDSISPVVSFNIALYKNPYPDITNIGDTNPFDGIFGYAEGSFIGDGFDLCNKPANTVYYPVDYTFVPTQSKWVNFISQDSEYYYYEVGFKFYIYPTPPLQLSNELQQKLNDALGNVPGSPITPGQLSQITDISFAGISSSNLNPVIFKYMSNLEILDLSGCNVDDIFLLSLRTLPKLDTLNLSNNHLISNLSVLPNILTSLDISSCNINNTSLQTLATLENLKSLDISNNSISDISKLPATLIASLKCLDASFTQSTLPPCVFTTFVSLNVNKFSDVSHLASFINLESLKLANQAISDISPLYNLLQYGNLKNLLVNNQEINYGDIYPSESWCSAACDFRLNTNFLKNVDGNIPTILCISHNGYCYDSIGDSCMPCDSCDLFTDCKEFTNDCECNAVMWDDISHDTQGYFTFKNNIISSCTNINFEFSGAVNVNLVVND